MNAPESRARGALITWALGLLTGVLVVLLFLALPKLAGHAQHGHFAVVDLAAIVRTNQQKAVAQMIEKGPDQASRAAAMSQAKAFGQRLDQEVRDLSAECGCVLLMREAVVAGDVQDLTPELVNRLARK